MGGGYAGGIWKSPLRIRTLSVTNLKFELRRSELQAFWKIVCGASFPTQSYIVPSVPDGENYTRQGQTPYDHGRRRECCLLPLF